jgi:hypothetical protein
VDDVASPRRLVCERKRQSRTGDSAGAVFQSVHMHRQAVVCSTPTTQQIPTASAFAQEESSRARRPDERFATKALTAAPTPARSQSPKSIRRPWPALTSGINSRRHSVTTRTALVHSSRGGGSRNDETSQRTRSMSTTRPRADCPFAGRNRRRGSGLALGAEERHRRTAAARPLAEQVEQRSRDADTPNGVARFAPSNLQITHRHRTSRN